MAKNPNEELLDEMYKSVKMGCENIANVIPKVEDNHMITELTARLEGYSNYAKTVSDMMRERGFEPKEPSMMARMGARMGTVANTMIDASSSHIAEMFIKGAEMGVEKLEKVSDRLSGVCENKITTLCSEIIEKEKRDNRKMENFL